MGFMLYRQFCYPKTQLVQFINELFFCLFMVLHGMLLLREAMHVRVGGSLAYSSTKIINGLKRRLAKYALIP